MPGICRFSVSSARAVARTAFVRTTGATGCKPSIAHREPGPRERSGFFVFGADAVGGGKDQRKEAMTTERNLLSWSLAAPYEGAAVPALALEHGDPRTNAIQAMEKT
jgi:hypothetical protein